MIVRAIAFKVLVQSTGFRRGQGLHSIKPSHRGSRGALCPVFIFHTTVPLVAN